MSTTRSERHSVANDSSAFPVVAFESQRAADDVSQSTTRAVPAYAAVGSPDYAYFEWDASQPVLSPAISASPPAAVISASTPSPITFSTSTSSTLRPAKRPRTDDDAPRGSLKVPRLAQEGGSSSPETATTEIPPKRKRVRKSDKGLDHIPRPLNCFILFKNDYIRRQRESGYEVMSKNILKEIGAIWRSLPHDQSQYWKEKAKGVKAKHEIVNPGYTYKPVHKKKMGRPPKGEPRMSDNAGELEGEKGKENDLRPEEDKVDKPADTLTKNEDGRAVETMRAVAVRQGDSLWRLQAQAHLPLHVLPLPQSALTVQYAETTSGWPNATQAVLQSQSQFTSAVTSFQQAGPSCLSSPHAWQPAHLNPMHSQNMNAAAYNGVVWPDVAYSATYHLTPGGYYDPSSSCVVDRAFSQSAPPKPNAQGPSEEDVAQMLAVLEEQELLVSQHRDSPDLETPLTFPAPVHDRLMAPEELPQSAGRFSDMLRDIDRWYMQSEIEPSAAPNSGLHARVRTGTVKCRSHGVVGRPTGFGPTKSPPPMAQGTVLAQRTPRRWSDNEANEQNGGRAGGAPSELQASCRTSGARRGGSGQRGIKSQSALLPQDE
ncbi:predicted protein [Postia placenta Mad-698-R]|uniref:HMG box domain-containing protein n=1 Tax=Postia placenta MAD-698-R-SB12 TaxID=670580 RepID=A0A1X6MKW6_9APHY|nr:hypothetical protein POSPLADRAFT_1158413 [Postia placenta MAD-698-R-SB12]EED80827.1 predicted protein [Postia placenta Mad-698-R]OSX56886.1 hypothetical protein POSPLADRAFT_1158413 [Postia placenta MAD-698-R-SB12]